MGRPKDISMYFRLRITLMRCLSMRILLWSPSSMRLRPTTRPSGQITILSTMWCQFHQPNNIVWVHLMETKTTIIKLLKIKMKKRRIRTWIMIRLRRNLTTKKGSILIMTLFMRLTMTITTVSSSQSQESPLHQWTQTKIWINCWQTMSSRWWTWMSNWGT